MEWISDPQAWIAFITLVALELVLGIDNIIFIVVLVGRLPREEQPKARSIGLALAMVTRILLLLFLAWMVKLTAPLFSIFGNQISGRDLILICGGLFLLGKSTHEIHQKLEGEEEHVSIRIKASFLSVIVQVMILDIVFSLDSVITAIGMVDQIEIMVTAVVLSVVFMLFLSKGISTFVERHPTVKMLALSFLLLIGFTLIVEGFDYHIPKGYIYFAMAFSVFVEMLNLRLGKVQKNPVKLHERHK